MMISGVAAMPEQSSRGKPRTGRRATNGQSGSRGVARRSALQHVTVEVSSAQNVFAHVMPLSGKLTLLR